MNVVCPRCGEIIDAKREEMMGRYIACGECCYVFFWYTNLREQKTINIEKGYHECLMNPKRQK